MLVVENKDANGGFDREEVGCDHSRRNIDDRFCWSLGDIPVGQPTDHTTKGGSLGSFSQRRATNAV